MALILATLRHHITDQSFSGVVGSGTSYRKAQKFWEFGDPVPLDQEYFQNKEGGFGQYYRTAMQAMGILEDPENPKWVYRLTDRGRNLAEAYQASIKNTRYYQALEEQGQLSSLKQSDVDEYGQVGCLCPQAIQKGQDRTLLLDTFFRFEINDQNNPHANRRNSLGVALDLVYSANNKFRRSMLRPALYLGEYIADSSYNPPIELRDWVKRWGMVEIRHLFTFGIQCLWAAFLIELRDKTQITRQDWFKWTKEKLNENAWQLTLKDLCQKLCAEAGISCDWQLLPGKVARDFGQNSGLDEYSLYLKASHGQADSVLLFSTGIRILLQLNLRYQTIYSHSGSIWAELALRGRIPLNEFFKNMDTWLKTQEFQVEDWIHEIYQEYIFEQHEMVALEKLHYQDYDTFKFYYEEGIFYWPTGKKPYREPIRLAGNRLNNCLTMLVDLGLILENPDGTMVLTADGIDYRIRVLKGIHNAH